MGGTKNVVMGVVLIAVALALWGYWPGVFWNATVLLILGAIPLAIGFVGLILLWAGYDEMRAEKELARVERMPQAAPTERKKKR